MPGPGDHMAPHDLRHLGTGPFHSREAQMEHVLRPGDHMLPRDLRQIGAVAFHSRRAHVHMPNPGDHMAPHDAAVPPHPDVAWELEDPARPAKAQEALLRMLFTSEDWVGYPPTQWRREEDLFGALLVTSPRGPSNPLERKETETAGDKEKICLPSSPTRSNPSHRE
jgi:hypothetical protein